MIAMHILNPGPPFRVALEWIKVGMHRRAVTALFAGDLFLARYAGNYFAKAFMPHTAAQLSRTAEASVDAARICIHCWHEHRHVHLEGEMHALLLCPRYERERNDFLKDLHSNTFGNMNALHGAIEKLRFVFQSHRPEDWQTMGKFISRVRQSRRSMRHDFQRRTTTLHRTSFSMRKAAWRARGWSVCRHGVFFEIGSSNFQCECMLPDSPDKWQLARFMPKIDQNLRAIVTVPFQPHLRCTLQKLQRALQRQDLHEGRPVL